MSAITMNLPRADVATLKKGIARRQAAEKRFRIYGLVAIGLALGMVALLFVTIVSKGAGAFFTGVYKTEVYFDPAIINVGQPPMPQPGQSETEYKQAYMGWQTQLALKNWNRIITQAMLRILPEAQGGSTRDLIGMVASGERYRLRDMVVENPEIIGQTVPVELLADANVDVWIKGLIDKSLDVSQQQLSANQQTWTDLLEQRGDLVLTFDWGLLFNVDSRSSPASAGLAGAFIGSLYMMLVVIVLAVPIGVASAVYLEEYAPKNRWTDLIEVNINNLAAVPSIVFGLLGAAVFINYLRLPLSAPLVGGMVLTLMTLPTIIIATRAALKAVPPSIREAALGIGASKTQSVFHHVLPLAMPGILTATIIGVAQALGETAPLLLIGMNAFVASVPATPLDQSTALPVQIYLWQGNELRNFFESRTSAAIIVLLLLMITLNAAAIVLRKRFERRW